MRLMYYMFMDVKVIKSGKIGTVIDVSDDSVLVEFPNGSKEWYFVSDIVELALC